MQDVTLAETGVLDLLGLFGDAKQHGEGGLNRETFVCYMNKEQRHTVVVFNLGFPYERNRVMGMSMSVREPFSLCAPTIRDLRAIASRSGVVLGMTRDAFTRALNLPFVERNDTLTFERVRDVGGGKRLPELTVTAAFKDGALVEYTVRRYDD